MTELAGKRVVVMGLGRFGGGVGAARFCAERGAEVLVTDQASEAALAGSVKQLSDLPLHYRLGEHAESDFTGADVVVVSPAVDRQRNRYVHAAERAGATLTSEIELLTERLPNWGRTIGVTGTAGKSTTTAMIGHILRERFGDERDRGPVVYVGGNLGGSLLPRVERIRPIDWVVLELSSFMLEQLAGFSPHIAVVTNIGPNHLDRHRHFDAYIRAKKTILHSQTRDDRVVLGPGVADWRYDTPAIDVIIDDPLEEELSVPGEHNRLNAALAVAACECAHLDRAACVEAVRSFPGLAHRLQLVCEHAGVRFYNDSKSTTPEAAIRAIRSFSPETVHLIAGGYDKGADLTPLAREAAERCAGLYTIGATGPALAEAAEPAEDGCAVHRCDTLQAAMRRAVQQAGRSQHVLLSPGCASWDQFDHYEARGRAFAELALRYTTET